MLVTYWHITIIKIICLANKLIFHRGSSAFTRRIVYFQLFGSSVFIQLEFREDRPLLPGSSAWAMDRLPIEKKYHLSLFLNLILNFHSRL